MRVRGVGRQKAARIRDLVGDAADRVWQFECLDVMPSNTIGNADADA
jgi:hypothetical protein